MPDILEVFAPADDEEFFDLLSEEEYGRMIDWYARFEADPDDSNWDPAYDDEDYFLWDM